MIAKRVLNSNCYTITASYESEKCWIFTVFKSEVLENPELLDGKAEISVDKETGIWDWTAIVDALYLLMPDEYAKLEKTFKKLNIKCGDSD